MKVRTTFLVFLGLVAACCPDGHRSGAAFSVNDQEFAIDSFSKRINQTKDGLLSIGQEFPASFPQNKKLANEQEVLLTELGKLKGSSNQSFATAYEAIRESHAKYQPLLAEQMAKVAQFKEAIRLLECQKAEVLLTEKGLEAAVKECKALGYSDKNMNVSPIVFRKLADARQQLENARRELTIESLGQEEAYLSSFVAYATKQGRIEIELTQAKFNMVQEIRSRIPNGRNNVQVLISSLPRLSVAAERLRQYLCQKGAEKRVWQVKRLIGSGKVQLDRATHFSKAGKNFDPELARTHLEAAESDLQIADLIAQEILVANANIGDLMLRY